MNIILSVFFVVLSAFLSKAYCRFVQNTRLMDKPNERSMHVIPTARGGGIVFIGLSVLSVPFVCYAAQTSLWEVSIFILSIVLLAAISFLDDLYHLSARSRFLVQCIVAGLISLFMKPDVLDFLFFSLTNSYLIVVFLFLAILWAINHFNFMDGLDGFCASQALFLFAAYSVLFSVHNAVMYQDFCLIFISTLLGFLIYNFPPARLFMGDIGSATLGLITFSIAVIAQQKYQIPLIYWFILNGLFLFDATVTLLRRIINKEQWSAPHKKHAYQRLKQLGISNHAILLGQIVLNGLFFALILLLQRNIMSFDLVLAIQITCILIIYCLIEKKFPMFAKMT